MPRNYFAGDPHWITAYYGGKCSECGTEIRKGIVLSIFPMARKSCVKLCADEMHMSDLSKKPKENIR